MTKEGLCTFPISPLVICAHKCDIVCGKLKKLFFSTSQTVELLYYYFMLRLTEIFFKTR